MDGNKITPFLGLLFLVAQFMACENGSPSSSMRSGGPSPEKRSSTAEPTNPSPSPEAPSDIWTDPSTGLVWQVHPTGGTMESDDATSHCRNLAMAEGGWRLPNISELRSLIRGCPDTMLGSNRCKVSDPGCLATACLGMRDFPCPETGKGPATGCYWAVGLHGKCDRYWSSSIVDDNEIKLVWGVIFHYGQPFYFRRDSNMAQYHVRCVK